MLPTGNAITLFLSKDKSQKFMENCHVNFYFLKNVHTGRRGKIRAHVWCLLLCLLRSRNLGPKVDTLFQYVCW